MTANYNYPAGCPPLPSYSQAPEELAPEAYELTAAAPVASEPLAAEPEVAPAEASGGGTAAAAAAAAAAVPESELQLAQEHLQVGGGGSRTHGGWGCRATMGGRGVGVVFLCFC